MTWLARLVWGRQGGPPTSLADWLAEAGSRNGYARQAAVEALGLCGDGSVLPALLQRANDWVPQVSQAAVAALGHYMDGDYVVHWAAAMGQLLALRRAARMDHAALLGRIEAYLLDPGHLATLAASLPPPAAMPHGVARYVHVLQLKAAVDDDARLQLLRAAVLSTDVVIAAGAAAAIPLQSTPGLRHALAGAACRARFAQVRAAGLAGMLMLPQPQALPSLLRAMAFDVQAGVRAAALRALSGLPVEQPGGQSDRPYEQVVAQARRVLRGSGNAKDRAVALDVLCALQVDDALALCEAASHDKAAAVRCTALRRRASQPGADREALVLAALVDASPSVQRLALRQVKDGASPPPSHVLRHLLDANPGALAALMGVAQGLSPWSRLDFLLGALATAQQLGQALPPDGILHAGLRQWALDMANCFVPPAAGQAAQLARCWAAVRDGVPASLQQRLADPMRAFGVLVRASG